MNTKRTFMYGFLAVIVALSLTGCPPEPGLSTLSGNVTISPDGTVNVNTELTAAYSGTETVTFQWYKDNIAISGEISSKYTPTTTGSYTVTVSRAGFNSKTSAAVTVNAAPTDITYTVTQTGGTDGTADTTAINFTFSASVTGLTASNITITDGTGAVTKGTLSGSDTSWSLGVTVTAAGKITVKITKSGIEAGTKDVTVYKAGETAPTDITYTVTQEGGTDGTADTTAINFTFSESIAGLTASNITVTDGTGAVTKGTLSGSGTSWALGVTVTTAGNLTIAIVKSGIEAAPKDVTVYKAGQTAPTLNSISAVYTQGATIVYPDTPLDDLKAGLAVTAAYSNGANLTVTAYALSGTLTVGSSTVTVTFEGKTTTFNVTVTAGSDPNPTKTLTGITLNTTSVRKGYIQNEQLNLTGLIVTANYSDSTSATVSYTSTSPVNGATLSTLGTITVTVNYTERAVTRSNTFTVTVTGPGTSWLQYELIDDGGDNDGTYRVIRTELNYVGSVTIPVIYNGLPVTEIGNEAFYGKSSISPVTIPEGINTIGNNAFAYCGGFTSITIPASVTSIGDEAFSNCRDLTSVIFESGSLLQTIGYSAFSGCRDLTSITIPAGVMSIGGSAFSPSLTSITFAEGSQLETINGFAKCTGLTSITIPASVTSIGETAFMDCTGLTNITIPAGVMSIGQYAFSGCTGITSINIPAGVTGIGYQAFANCTGITSITIPASLTSISGEAFSGWTSSQTIYIERHISQSAADQAWGSTWRYPCNAVIVYGIVSEIVQLNRTVFSTGEQLVSIAAIIRYSNNATEIVAIPAADITGFDSATAGTKTLTVTYRDKTATFTVTVLDLANLPNDILLVTNTAQWNAAVTSISTGGNNQSYTIYVNGSFNVAGSAANTFGSVSGLTVTLIGNGTVSLNSNGSLLRAGANQTIIIDSENLILRGRSGNDNSLVYVDGSSAKLELKNGTISGNVTSDLSRYDVPAYAYGGGVYVGASGTFIMSGGTISGNTAEARITSTEIGGIPGDADAYGGGVYNVGTFTMSGGSISGNTTRTSGRLSRSYGGGVYSTGTFTMTGGSISGNTATSNGLGGSSLGSNAYAYGGGVYGTFRIVTGTIYGNTESNTSLRNVVTSTAGTGNSYANGAALYGTAQRGTFSIPGDITSTWNSMGNLTTTDYTIW